ncbi:MAG: SIS domain-containing protein [Pseudomonadota bacterium]|jgi:D-sedoheptulose 7-phosphate isomerase
MPIDKPGATRRRIDAALLEASLALDALRTDENALGSLEAASELMIDAFSRGGRVYACGNGGSMSDAMHFAEELTGRFRQDRAGLPAQAISDVGHLTCVANDFGYSQVFSRFVQSHGRAGDCLLAISTSGASENVLNAARAAREMGMSVVGLTGRTESQLDALCDVCVATPAGRFADRAQELHIKVIHIMIELIESRIFPQNYEQEAAP